MNMRSNLILGITAVLMSFLSCEKSVTIKSNPSRFIASEKLIQIKDQDKMPSELKSILNDNIKLKNSKKFSIAYFLIPNDDINLGHKELLPENIMNQLTMSISGKKHFRLFITSASQKEYENFLGTYRFVEADESEFFAISSSSDTFIIWTKDNESRLPFQVTNNKTDEVDTFKISNKDKKQPSFVQTYKKL